MATGTWSVGKDCPVKFTPAGGSLQTLQVTDHSWKEMVDKIDFTHTGSGGVQALLAGILRGDGTVKAFLDSTGSSTKYYSTTVGVRAGNSGVLLHYVTAALFYTIPGLIGDVLSAAPVAGGVSYEFTISLNSEAGAYSMPL